MFDKAKYFRIYRRRRADRFKANGNCIDCGIPCKINPQTKKPFSRCKKHRIAHSSYSRNYYANHNIDQRINRFFRYWEDKNGKV